MTDVQKAELEELRKPFPAESVGILPKPYRKDSEKGKCQECGGYHGLPAVHLDYVGHAAVTDRLLSVDPQWSWEPFAVDENGLPALDSARNLWIRLTILGVTRIGVGDGASAKEAIGDAIRNAAMRFGVALDLWSKEELESATDPAAPAARPRTRKTAAAKKAAASGDPAPPAEDEPPPPTASDPGEAVSKNQIGLIQKFASDLGLDRDARLLGISKTIGRTVTTSKDLTKREATAVIDGMKAALDRQAALGEPEAER